MSRAIPSGGWQDWPTHTGRITSPPSSNGDSNSNRKQAAPAAAAAPGAPLPRTAGRCLHPTPDWPSSCWDHGQATSDSTGPRLPYPRTGWYSYNQPLHKVARPRPPAPTTCLSTRDTASSSDKSGTSTGWEGQATSAQHSHVQQTRTYPPMPQHNQPGKLRALTTHRKQHHHNRHRHSSRSHHDPTVPKITNNQLRRPTQGEVHSPPSKPKEGTASREQRSCHNRRTHSKCCSRRRTVPTDPHRRMPRPCPGKAGAYPQPRPNRSTPHPRQSRRPKHPGTTAARRGNSPPQTHGRDSNHHEPNRARQAPTTKRRTMQPRQARHHHD